MQMFKNQKIVLASCATLAIISLFAAGCVSSGKGLSSNLAQGEKDTKNTSVQKSIKNTNSKNNSINSVEEIQLNDNDFLISLAENPSTGFVWQYKITNPALVALKSDYFESAEETGLVGKGGMRHLVFTCKKDGKSSIELVYCRPWKGGETAERRVVNVEYANDDALSWSMEKLDFVE